MKAANANLDTWPQVGVMAGSGMLVSFFDFFIMLLLFSGLVLSVLLVLFGGLSFSLLACDCIELIKSVDWR